MTESVTSFIKRILYLANRGFALARGGRVVTFVVAMIKFEGFDGLTGFRCFSAKLERAFWMIVFAVTWYSSDQMTGSKIRCEV